MSSFPAALVVLLFAALAGCASRPADPHGQVASWDLSAYEDKANAIRLRKPDGTVAGTLAAAEIQQLRSTKRSIERAAGYSDDALLIVTDLAQPNAFAGFTREANKRFVAITLPMISLLGDDAGALAHLLGHELAHHVKGHGKASSERESLRKGVSVVFGTLLSLVGVPLGGTLVDVGTQAVATVYSREQEREADELGFGYAVSAGYDAQGAVRLFEKLAAGSRSSAIPFLSTHPSSAERTENMQRLINSPRPSAAQ